MLCILLVVYILQDDARFVQCQTVRTGLLGQSPCEAKGSTSSQTSKSWWNLKLYCRIHKISPPVLILSQINPLQDPPPHSPFKTNFNIVIPPTPSSSKLTQVSPPKLCLRLFYIPYVPLVQLNLFFLV